MVAIEKLTKLFPRSKGEPISALHSASFEAADGELIVVLGPSGSGKTTLLRLLAGLEQPTSGHIRINGESMWGVPPQDREVAMVFQEHALYPHMTVRENLSFGLRLRKVPPADAAARVDEIAQMLGVNALLDRQIRELSGGERQRVALGRAMVQRPRLFLLDEPFSNLDAPLRAQLRRDLVKLQRRLGITTLYVTHDQQEAMALGTRMAVLHEGVLQQIGAPQQVYSEPANLFVAGFIGTPPMNRIPGTLVNKGSVLWFRSQGDGTASGQELRFQVADRARVRLCARAGDAVVTGLRPEHARELGVGERCASEELEWSAVAETVEPLGWETHVTLRNGTAPFVARLCSTTAAQTGAPLRLALRVAEACYFAVPGGERIG